MFPPRCRCALFAVLISLTLSASATAAPAPAAAPTAQDYIAAVSAVLHGMVDLFPQVNNDQAFRRLEHAVHDVLFLFDNHPKKNHGNGALARGMKFDRGNNGNGQQQQQGALAKGMGQGKKAKGGVGALAGKKGGHQQKGGGQKGQAQQKKGGKAGNVGALAGQKKNAKGGQGQKKQHVAQQAQPRQVAPKAPAQAKAQLVNPLPKQAKNARGKQAPQNVAGRAPQGNCNKNQNPAARGAQQFVAFNPAARQMGQVGARGPQKHHAKKK